LAERVEVVFCDLFPARRESPNRETRPNLPLTRDWGMMMVPAEEKVVDRQPGQDPLHAALHEFLAAGALLREGAASATLRFPNAVHLPLPEDLWRRLAPSSLLRCTAPVDQAFAALAVALHDSKLFEGVELWSGTARFVWPGDRGSWLRTAQDSTGRVSTEVRHETTIGVVERGLMEGLCSSQMKQIAADGEVEVSRPATCPTCGVAEFRPLSIDQDHGRGACFSCASAAGMRELTSGESGGPGARGERQQRATHFRTAGYAAPAGSGMFDVFISYSHRDEAVAVDLAQRLKGRGVRPWLDIWEMYPGKPWLQAILEQIDSAASAAVIIGPSGMGPWQRDEMWFVLQQFFARRCPVIPVLLDGADEADMPSLLRNMQSVDFSRTTPDPMDSLVWGITGVRP
jgi:hypothetical protein